MNRWNDTVSVISRYGVPQLLQKKKKYITCTHQALMSQFTHHGSLFAAAGVGITRLKPVGHKYSAQNMHSECHEDFS